MARALPSKEGTTFNVEGLVRASQGRDMALTVLYVPYSLDFEMGAARASRCVCVCVKERKRKRDAERDTDREGG